MINAKDFNPEVKGKSDKFSWNFYKFLKKNPYHFKIYKSTWCPVNGILKEPSLYYIGYMDEHHWFSGTMLIGVCCSNLECYAYGPAHDTENWIDITEEFYKKYAEIGVCAIPGYNRHNWKYSGKTKRTCLNCGFSEKRHTIRVSQQVWVKEGE